MGRVGFRIGTVACLAALGAISGCGSSGSPSTTTAAPAPMRVSIALTNHGVVARPIRIGFAPPKGQQTRAPSNSERPLAVVFEISNRTDHSSFLEIHGSGGDFDSKPVPAHGQDSFPVGLRTSSYFVTADKIPTTNEPILEVGPYRTPE